MVSYFNIFLEFLLCFLIIIPRHKFRNLFAYIYIYILIIQLISIKQIGFYIPSVAFSNINEIFILGYKPILYFILIIAIIYIFIRYANKFKLSKYYIKISDYSFVILLISIIFSTYKSPMYCFIEEFYKFMQEFTLKHKLNENQKNDLIRSITKNKIIFDSNVSSFIKPDRYNVILFFVESLSNAPISKELTPNIYNFLSKSIDVKNYYNHTAGTARGIRGQIYSFFVLKGGSETIDPLFKIGQDKYFNKIKQSKLISLADILNSKGYYSYFQIGSVNKDFIKFISYMGYKKLITFKDYKDNFVLDKDSFILLEQNLKNIEKRHQPFFYTIYTHQTHHSFDASMNYKHLNKSNFNKFYNFDYYFGKFINWFNKSNLKNNTIIILTADHAHFPGFDYKDDFPKSSDYFIDKVIFGIYKFGNKPNIFDANNLSSLDLAPTICDILGIKEAKNTFLGRSIFEKDHNKIEKVYTTNVYDFFKIKDNKVEKTDKEEIKNNKKFIDKIIDYKIIGG